MAEETTPRPASPPLSGALRDAVRTFVAFVVAFGFAKLTQTGLDIDLTGAQEGLVVILTSAILAFVGKAMRNHGISFGSIV